MEEKKPTLRRYQPGDEPALVQWLNDPIIQANTLLLPNPYTLQEARSWVSGGCARAGTDQFAIALERKLAGGIGLRAVEPHKAELGYWLGEPYRGKGVMTAAVLAVTDYAFSILGLSRIYAPVFVSNTRSMRVLEKTGYTQECIAKSYFLKDNVLTDAAIFVRLKEKE